MTASPPPICPKTEILGTMTESAPPARWLSDHKGLIARVQGASATATDRVGTAVEVPACHTVNKTSKRGKKWQVEQDGSYVGHGHRCLATQTPIRATVHCQASFSKATDAQSRADRLVDSGAGNGSQCGCRKERFGSERNACCSSLLPRLWVCICSLTQVSAEACWDPLEGSPNCPHIKSAKGTSGELEWVRARYWKDEERHEDLWPPYMLTGQGAEHPPSTSYQDRLERKSDKQPGGPGRRQV